MAQSKARKTAKQVSEAIESQGKDIAHKIWLAGIGAYGRAFDEAKGGVENLTETTNDVFEDLVQRGAEIENDVRDRLASNERLTGAAKNVSRVVETASQFQEKQLERFEERMERMRGLLGLPGASDKASKLHEKIDRLEDEIAALSSEDKTPSSPKALKDRLARLTSEIDAIAEANAPAAKKAPVKRKPAAAKKTGAAKKTTAAKKAPARKTTKKA